MTHRDTAQRLLCLRVADDGALQESNLEYLTLMRWGQQLRNFLDCLSGFIQRLLLGRAFSANVRMRKLDSVFSTSICCTSE